jgi:hypothetical protein
MRWLARRGLRLGLVPLALLAALVACSLGWQEDDAPAGDNAANESEPRTVPVVTVVSPQDQQQFPVNQPIDIVVEASAAATRVQLTIVDEGRVGSTSVLPDQPGPKTAVLSWTPTKKQTYVLEVIAYNNTLPSDPVRLSVVVGEGSLPAGGATPASTCPGRVVIENLNFRAAPDTAARKLDQFAVDEQVTIIGRNAGGTWLQIRRGSGQVGWASKNPDGSPPWIEIAAGCESGLPVAGE